MVQGQVFLKEREEGGREGGRGEGGASTSLFLFNF